MVSELEALRLAGISVFAVAMSSRVDERLVLSISTLPQLIGRNYFLSASVANLNSLSVPLATQVSRAVLSACFEKSNCKSAGTRAIK